MRQTDIQRQTQREFYEMIGLPLSAFLRTSNGISGGEVGNLLVQSKLSFSGSETCTVKRSLRSVWLSLTVTWSLRLSMLGGLF